MEQFILSSGNTTNGKLKKNDDASNDNPRKKQDSALL